MDLLEDRAQNLETSKESSGEQPASPYSNIQCAISGFIEAVIEVAVGSEDRDLMAQVLQAYCSVNNKAFGAANSKIRVEENDALLLGLGRNLFLLLGPTFHWRGVICGVFSFQDDSKLQSQRFRYLERKMTCSGFPRTPTETNARGNLKLLASVCRCFKTDPILFVQQCITVAR